MTNLIPVILLWTNPVPFETSMPTRYERITKHMVIERSIFSSTNSLGVINMTNDVVKSPYVRKQRGEMVWTDAPLTEADLKSSPQPQMPGSVRQSP